MMVVLALEEEEDEERVCLDSGVDFDWWW